MKKLMFAPSLQEDISRSGRNVHPASRPWLKKYQLLSASIIIVTILLMSSALGAQTVQTFYVPVTEEQVRTWMMGINGGANNPDVTTVISITATYNGTILYYDHWEDGYEDDITNPAQSTTQIWGDSNIANGAPPGCLVSGCDIINAGTVITLRNSVPANPRDQGNLFFDGRDKFSSTGQLVVTRAGWQTAIGTVFAGAAEVFDTRKWGTSFEMPVGTNSPAGAAGQMFEYTAMSIMARDDNTTVQIDTDASGGVDFTTTLNQGESVYIPLISQSATVTSSAVIQVNLLTGDIGTNYEGRWFRVIPTNQWSSSYFSPVSTQPNATNAIILYNPDPASAITVNVTTSAGPQAPINIPARSIARFLLTGSGARFFTGGAPFYAMMTGDWDNQAYEWGCLLIPEQDLTPSVVVGWAPGSDIAAPCAGTPCQNDSPVWITPVANTTIYVDYDGNPATGALTDPLGNRYDVSYALTALQSQLINDADFDMTGARIYTVDGIRIAAAWGENSGAGVTGAPAMDLGTTVLPFPSLTAYKNASVYGDYNGNGGLDPGEVILYTIRVNNSGIVPITNINLIDALDTDVTYVANTTTVGGSSIPDDTVGTRFPLDDTGYNVVVFPAQLLPNQDIFVTFQVTVNNPFPLGKTQVNNNVTVSSVAGAEIFLNTQTQLVLQGALQTAKASSAAGLVRPGDTTTYTITVTNTSTAPQTGIRLNDPLPPGTAYVANSTLATGPVQKFVYDKFDKLLYSNNDGPQNWKTDWVETDAGGGGATGGNVQVTNGELRFTTNTSAAYRVVDLPAADFPPATAYAQLRFNFRTNPTVVAADAVVVEMSNNGIAGPFTILETFTNITGATSGSRVYDVSGYISANTTVRFRVTAGYGAGKYFYADKVEIRAVGAFTRVLDQFSVNAYTNNNGPNNWATNWTENDSGGGGATGGKVQVIGGVLRLNGPPTAGTEPSVWRSANLNQHVMGILKFDVSTAGAPVATDTAVVEISKDGTNFTILETFAGAVTGTRTYDIANYLSAATTVRFRITGNYSAVGRYFNADNVEIKAGRQLPATKDNIPAGANPDLANGVPADLVLPSDGFALAPNEVLTVTYRVTVDNPAGVTRVINTVTVTDQEKAPTSTAIAIDTVNNGGTIGNLVWLDTIANGVYDAGEPGLYNVRVWLDSNGNGTFDAGIDLETRTGTDGKYLFSALPPGTYRVYLDSSTIPAGLSLSVGSNPSPPIVITAEEIFLNTDFGYVNGNPAAALIGNYVWSDYDNDGMQDPGEAGLGSVTIALATGPGPDTVYGTIDDIIFSTLATNAFGTFLFTNVPPGTYVVIAGVGPDGIPGNADDDLSGYTPTAGPESVGSRVSSPVTVLGGSSYLMFDFGFRNPATYTISNRIWFDSDSNGVSDPGEPGIKDVTVNLLDTFGNVVAAATSDLNGNFTFSGVQNGDYTIRVEDANGKLIGFAGTTAAALSRTLAVTVSGGNLAATSFGYFASGRVGDIVWRDLNGNGQLDTVEVGIAGVQVDLYKDTNGNGLLEIATDQFIGTTTTDSDGKFMFQTSGGGRFFASVATGQAPLTGLVLTTTDDQPAAGFQRTVHLLTVFESNLTADFGFNTPGQIGHAVWNDLNGNGVKDAGEPGISGVVVRLYQDTGGGVFDPAVDTLIGTTTTDGTGSYVFQAAATGTYFVSVDDTQTPVVLMTRTTPDDQAAAGVQRTVNVTDLNISYLTNNFGFVTLASDLSVTKTANPPGDVYPGNVITYTITITNNSATTQTGITVSDPLPANTAYVANSTVVKGSPSNNQIATATLYAFKDTYLNEQVPNNNYGSTNPLAIQRRAGRTQRPIAQFDLSSINTSATVGSAQMDFYVTSANANLTANAFALTQAWSEGIANGAACGAAPNYGATWNNYNLSACNQAWTTAGGDYSATPLGSFIVSPIGYMSVTGEAVNLITQVEAWIAAPATNFGVILNGTAAANQNASISSAGGPANQRERLIVRYDTKTNAVGDPSPLVNGTPSNILTAGDGFSLAPGESMTVTYRVTVGSTPDIPEIRNVATASTSQTNAKKAFVVNPMKYTSDLRVTKAIQSYSAPCPVGSCTVTYLITLSNIGSVAESNITVNDILPPELSFASATPSQGSYNSGTGNWDIPGPLAAGSSATLTLVANVLTRDLDIQNCATLTAATPADQNAANNSSCASFYPTQVAVSDFRSFEEKGQVIVEWTTTSEKGTAGFYLLRLDEASGRYLQLNSRLLPALLTSPQGGRYSLIDTGASRDATNTYILVEVEGSGARSYHGPYIVNVNGYRAKGVVGGAASDAVNFFLSAADTSGPPASSGNTAVARSTDRDGTLIINIGNSGKATRSVAGSLSSQGIANFIRQPRDLPADRLAQIEAQKALRESVQSSPQTGSLIKIAVAKDGLYYLGASEIARLFGTSVSEVKILIQGRRLGLSNKGSMIAYTPDSGNTGIYFYGQGIDSRYSEDNIYWLSQGTGVLMETRGGQTPSLFLPGAFTETVHAEEDRSAVPSIFFDPEADFWLWDYIVAGDPVFGSRLFPIQADGVADVSSLATLAVSLNGFTSSSAALDHHVQIHMNGTIIGEDSWKGIGPRKLVLDFDQQLLVNGNNTVTVTGLTDTGAPYSIFFVDSLDLTYQRMYEAVGNSLIFSSEGRDAVTVSGFSNPEIVVLDISDPGRPKIISAAAIRAEGATYSVSFTTCHADVSRQRSLQGSIASCIPGARFLALAPGAASGVPKTWAVVPPNLSSQTAGADYIIITPKQLFEAAQQLAVHRRSRAMRTMVVLLEDIMNEFNYGIASPEAIRSFLTYAYRNWRIPPRYVVLAGKGTFDYKDVQGRGDNLIPPLFSATPWGLSATDTLFGDVTGDHLPEIAVGRLPVTTPEEFQTVITKIIAREQSGQTRVLLVADRPDNGGDFPAESDAISALIPVGYAFDKLYLSAEPIATSRQMLLDILNNGMALMNYVGHGGVDRLSKAGLLRTGDLASLTNGSGLPVVVAMTCSAGDFSVPGYQSLSEALVLKQDGGAAAVWAPTGLSLSFQAHVLDEGFFRAAFTDSRLLLGDVLLKAYRHFSTWQGPAYMIDIYTLQGDPAMKMW